MPQEFIFEINSMYEKNNHLAERRDTQKPVGEALEKVWKYKKTLSFNKRKIRVNFISKIRGKETPYNKAWKKNQRERNRKIN